MLDGWLHPEQTAGADFIPSIGELGDHDCVAGNRLGAINNQPDKRRRKYPQTSKAEDKSDHGAPLACLTEVGEDHTQQTRRTSASNNGLAAPIPSVPAKPLESRPSDRFLRPD